MRHLTSLIPSWERSLALRTLSPETMRSHGEGARLLEAFGRDNFGVTSSPASPLTTSRLPWPRH